MSVSVARPAPTMTSAAAVLVNVSGVEVRPPRLALGVANGVSGANGGCGGAQRAAECLPARAMRRARLVRPFLSMLRRARLCATGLGAPRGGRRCGQGVAPGPPGSGAAPTAFGGGPGPWRLVFFV